MAYNSLIEWTTSTWNPVTGCTKISDGCKHCYAEKMAKRLQGIGNPKYKRGFAVSIHKKSLNEPLQWKRPQMIFVCSMGDLFHQEVPDDFIIRVFKTMAGAKHHIFQVLTKRSERLLSIAPKLSWTDNIWFGVTVESDKYLHRIDHLRKTPSRIKFLSLEPLISKLPPLNLEGIHWVIVGGESGTNSRPLQEEWVIDIRDQCIEKDVPFFFKQWGGLNKKKAGRLLEGKIWDSMPKIPELELR